MLSLILNSTEPNSVDVSVQNQQDVNEITQNFVLTGFTLSGMTSASRLSTCKLDDLPSLRLKLSSSSSEIEYLTQSEASGAFSFGDVSPGDYSLTAVDANVVLEPSSKAVSMVWGGTTIPKSVFTVKGSRVSGSITVDGSSASDVDVYLIAEASKSERKLLECEVAQDVAHLKGKSIFTSVSYYHPHLYRRPNLPASFPASKYHICHSRTNADGVFAFETVPCGTYTLVPRCEKSVNESDKKVKFDVVPKQLEVVVEYGIVVIAIPIANHIRYVCVRHYRSHVVGSFVPCIWFLCVWPCGSRHWQTGCRCTDCR